MLHHNHRQDQAGADRRCWIAHGVPQMRVLSGYLWETQAGLWVLRERCKRAWNKLTLIRFEARRVRGKTSVVRRSTRTRFKRLWRSAKATSNFEFAAKEQRCERCPSKATHSTEILQPQRPLDIDSIFKSCWPILVRRERRQRSAHERIALAQSVTEPRPRQA